VAANTITVSLLAKDLASAVFNQVGDNATKNAERLRKNMGLAAIAAAAAIVKFGVDSVQAFAEAQASQAKLQFAYDKFPALADVNIKSLQKMNEALAKKTRFDDDAIAVGQAQLAQYGLTGTQLKKLTPLLLDYAARTGKDVASASEDLGKALLGSGRALKDVGIDFQDTGSVAGNFDTLIGDLGTSVSGFAEKDVETASGKLEQMRNRFGEIEEKIGAALMPALDGLAKFIESDVLPAAEDLGGWLAEDGIPGLSAAVDWVVKWKDVLGPAATAVGFLTGAQIALNIAMDANPIGLAILLLGALIGVITLVITNFDAITTAALDGLNGIGNFSLGLSVSVAQTVQSIVNGVLGMIRTVLGPINSLREALGFDPIALPKNVDYVTGVQGMIGTLNKATELAKGTVASQGAWTGAFNPSTGQKGGRTGGRGIPALAAGGIVSTATLAMIGEGSQPEVVAPLSKLPQIAAAAGIGGSGGSTFEIHGDAQMFMQFLSIVERKQDGQRKLVSKMGKA
jgi:hypothetical protein